MTILKKTHDQNRLSETHDDRKHMTAHERTIRVFHFKPMLCFWFDFEIDILPSNIDSYVATHL